MFQFFYVLWIFWKWNTDIVIIHCSDFSYSHVTCNKKRLNVYLPNLSWCCWCLLQAWVGTQPTRCSLQKWSIRWWSQRFWKGMLRIMTTTNSNKNPILPPKYPQRSIVLCLVSYDVSGWEWEGDLNFHKNKKVSLFIWLSYFTFVIQCKGSSSASALQALTSAFKCCLKHHPWNSPPG